VKQAEFERYMDEHPEVSIVDEVTKNHGAWDQVKDSIPSGWGWVFLNRDTGRFYAVDVNALKGDITVKEFEEIVGGKREAVGLVTVSRIVGYYSYSINWNKSKLGELKDRRKGDYGIGEPPKEDSESAGS